MPAHAKLFIQAHPPAHVAYQLRPTALHRHHITRHHFVQGSLLHVSHSRQRLKNAFASSDLPTLVEQPAQMAYPMFQSVFPLSIRCIVTLLSILCCNQQAQDAGELAVAATKHWAQSYSTCHASMLGSKLVSSYLPALAEQPAHMAYPMLQSIFPLSVRCIVTTLSDTNQSRII